MPIQLKESLRETRLTDISTLIDAGSVGGKIKGYNGSQPATGGTATTLLFTCIFSTTAFGAPSSAVMTANSITDDASADATSTATWFRVTDSDDNFVFDAPIALLNLNTNSITSGANVSVTSFVLTGGNP